MDFSTEAVSAVASINSMPREVVSSTESLVEAPVTPRNFYVNLEKFSNSAEIVDMLEGNLLNPLFNNKYLDVKLKVEINPLKKSSLKKKKPLLYSNNKYILFTQLISRLKLEWKSSNKMWSLMGINSSTGKPYDENGHPLYHILSQIELFHKSINEYDTVLQKDENGVESSKMVKNIERTDRARKHAVEYALALLVAFYEGAEPPRPDPDHVDAVSIYKHVDSFKLAMEKFRVFVDQHRGVTEDVKPPIPTANKIKKTTKKTVKKNLSSEMVSDMLEQSSPQQPPQYSFTLN
ncbi:39k [Spodoptera frugiperda granulovirus]|uniref:39k n=1 Tax=Spodoptera frugiperda granulovirus TaxID=307454 RepID=A0A0C5B319_9BBAC|nr:39k [Spodoptera frugiperda granulovirus]AJK91705.1 39k [Spodoptera frugiperda granulovirus]AXS01065.1 39k [Spodoptera frugiperda granulovirus]